MATIYIRARETGRGRRFDVRFRRLGRYSKIEHAGTFKSKREAEIRLRLVSDLLAAGKNPKLELTAAGVEASLFRDMHAAWVGSRIDVSAATLDLYRQRAPALNDTFGGTPVDQIAVADVIAWVQKLNQSYKPGTIRLFVSDLKQVLDFARLPVNVARDRAVRLPQRRRTELVPPNAEQVLDALRRAPVSHRLLIITMEQLGSRVSETLALGPDDIWVDKNQVRFARENTKNGGSGRVVKAPEFLVQALAESLPFKSEHRTKINHTLRASGFSAHDLRHRRASLWAQTEGVSPPEYAQWLGHSKASMSLDVYSHVMPLDEIPHQTLASFLR